MLNKLFGRSKDEEFSLDELSDEEFSEAVDVLEMLDREPSKKNIAWLMGKLNNDETDLSQDVDLRALAPEELDESPNIIEKNGKYSTIYTAGTFPNKVDLGWMVRGTFVDKNIRHSLHIDPIDSNTIRNKLEHKMGELVTSMWTKQEKGRVDTHEESEELEEINQLLRKISSGKTKLYNVSLYNEIFSDDKKSLKNDAREINRLYSEQSCLMSPLEMRQVESQNCVAPVAKDTLNVDYKMQLEALATTFNMVEPPINEEGGILLGFDATDRPVILDRFDLSGHSKVVAGKIGSGKSFSTKSEMFRTLMLEPEKEVIVFDPLGDDFSEFVRNLGGQVIKFGGEYTINPFDISATQKEIEQGEDIYTLKVRSIIGMLKTYLEDRGGMDAEHEGILQKAIKETYRNKGITQDPETFDNEPPTMSDLIKMLEKFAESKEYDVPEEYQRIAKNMVPKLESFKKGGVNYNLNGHTNLDLKSRLVCFDMSSFADRGELPLLMFTMLDWAYNRAKSNDNKIDVIFEEAHYLLKRKASKDYINLFIRHSRHFNSGLVFITQTLDEFLNDESSKEVLDNCDVKQIFYMDSVSDEAKDEFNFTDEEVQAITRAARGESSGYSECLLGTTEHGRRQLEVHVGPFEKAVIDDDLDPWKFLHKQGEIQHEEKRYIKKLKQQEVPNEPTPLLKHGRKYHKRWLQQTVSDGDVLDRRFFMAIPGEKMDKSDPAEHKNPLLKLIPSLGSDIDEGANSHEQAKLNAESVTSLLPKTGVKTNLINSKQKAFEALHLYYKNSLPDVNTDFIDIAVSKDTKE